MCFVLVFILQCRLGEGNFGVVYEGKATGLVPGKKVAHVAIKTLSNPELEEEFHMEADIMKEMSQSDRIVRLLGLCTKEQPYLMLMELMSNGDLKEVGCAAPITEEVGCVRGVCVCVCMCVSISVCAYVCIFVLV